MSNYKIRVNSKSESKEAQQLFFELGYNWFKKGYVEVKTPETIMSFENGALSTGIRGSINHKEITLPQLRDLVVLKRNNREDANVSEENCLYDLYLTESKELYFYHCSKNKWILSNLNGDDDYYESLKPIEKPMKEYLDPENGYKLNLTDRPFFDWIEIPEGSETFNYYDRKDNLFFLKGTGENALFSNDLNDWEWKEWGDIDFDGVVCLWSRHTLPEELPFIGDEPLQSLNDQYAEIEKVRQSHRTASETADPTIKETLSQRQDQYGSFEDVAMITEQMVDIMRKGYYENLAYNQKMALYMICSKMARIVNGNPNHKDSWHDIAGYATLIDNELVSEKDMPF